MAENFALVTGASSGIGLAISTELARRGYPLVMVSNEETKLAEAAQELEAAYQIKAIALYMDLAQRDSSQQIFDYCETNKVKIEILIKKIEERIIVEIYDVNNKDSEYDLEIDKDKINTIEVYRKKRLFI